MATQKSQTTLKAAKAKQKSSKTTSDPFARLEQRQRRCDEAAEAYYHKKQNEDAVGYAEFRNVWSMAIAQLMTEFRQDVKNNGYTINPKGEIVRMESAKKTTEGTSPTMTKEQMLGLVERARRDEPAAIQELDAFMKADNPAFSKSSQLLDIAKQKFYRLVSGRYSVSEMALTTNMDHTLKALESSYDGPLEKLIVEHMQFAILVAQSSLLQNLDERTTDQERSVLNERAKESALTVGELYNMLRSHKAIVASNLNSVASDVPTP